MHLYDAAFYFSLFGIFGIGLSVIFGGISNLFLIVIFLVFFLFIELIGFLKEDKFLKVLGIIFLIIIFLGFFYGKWILSQKKEIFPEIGKEVQFLGEVERSPEFKDKSQILKINLENPYQGEISLYTDIFNNYKKGNVLEIKGKIREGKYKNFYLSFPEITNKEGKTNLLNFLWRIKDGFVKEFNKFLPSKEASLLAGMTLGERSGFSEEFKESLSKSGTTHIVALSGYNITILVVAIGMLFGFLFPKRRTFSLTILIIILFVLMVGGEPSIIRAAIMGIIALLATKTSRIYSARNAIMISAFVMTVLNPKSLFEAGFELSFLALIGIVYLLPALSNFIGRSEEISFLNWKDNLLTTFSAQVMVLPLILYHFKSFSLWSLISNVLILEFIPYVMFLGFCLGGLSVFGILGYPLSFLVSGLSWIILKYQTLVIEFFSRSSSLNLEISLKWAIIGGLLYYLLIIFFIKRQMYNKRQ